MFKRFKIEYIFSAIFVLVALISIIGNTLTLHRLEKNYRKTITTMEEIFKTLYLTKQLSVLSHNVNVHGTNYFLSGDEEERDRWEDYRRIFFLTAKDLRTAPSFSTGLGMAELDRLEVIQKEKAQALISNQTLSAKDKREFFLTSQWRKRNEELRILLNRLVSNEINHYNKARESLIDYKDSVMEGNSIISLSMFFLFSLFLYVVYQLSRRLRLAHQSALNAIKSRDELLAVVSHDLKNPLSAISMSTEVMLRRLEGNGDSNIRKGLERIKMAVAVMMDLIKDLLDHAKLETGKLELEIQDENFYDALRKTEELLAPLIKSKSIKIINDFSGPSPVVKADKTRLIQILTNLISNAVKFSPEGSKIEVRAKVKGKELKVWIRDYGEGIASKDIPHVFDRYWQKKKTSKMGTGLGLPIVKELVHAHSGRIWVESKEGEGTTFFFTLPLQMKHE